MLEFPEYGLHEHTVDQELRTLCNRHLFATPEPDLKSIEWRNFCRLSKRVAKEIGYIPRATAREVVGHRIAMKKLRFGRGMENYLRRGVRPQDAILTEMQKLEFYEVGNLENKEDRGIQFRNPTFNAALARHLHHCERAFYDHMLNDNGTPMIAKGYSPLERGLIIDAMCDGFTNPKYLCIDHSRYDAHYNEHLLKNENQFWAMLRNFDPEVVWLLKRLLKGTGFSMGGIVYKIKAKRCSGDLTTGMGNTRTNLFMIITILNLMGVRFRVFCDGDDAFIVVEGSIDVEELKTRFLKFGMVTEATLHDDIRDAEFCQSKLIRTVAGPVMVRNPRKVLDVLTKCPRKLDPARQKSVLAASAMGELMQAPGVPVLSVAAAALCRLADAKPMFITPDDYGRFQVYRTKDVVVQPDDTSRHDFERAWDMPICDQLAIETYYRDMGAGDGVIQIPEPGTEKCYEFDIWDDATIFYEPTPVNRWWRERWAVGQLLND